VNINSTNIDATCCQHYNTIC